MAHLDLTCERATEADASVLTSLHNAVAADLTQRYGRGHWSYTVSDASSLRAIKASHVLVARTKDGIAGTLQLQTTKPWAIDPAYFAKVDRPLYLLSMAVAPELQRQNIGMYLVEQAIEAARGWPANAIRLDAYDADAGAGGFYAKCGFREAGRVIYRGTPLIYFELVL